jgi:hypothetical protein
MCSKAYVLNMEILPTKSIMLTTVKMKEPHVSSSGRTIIYKETTAGGWRCKE